MTNREKVKKVKKVIQGLEHCGQPMKCDGCTYNVAMGNCFMTLKSDAMELLKEQEPLLVLNIIRTFIGRAGNCPSCWRGLDSTINTHYCGECGQAVKWDEDD